jgi:hypothetical protein
VRLKDVARVELSQQAFTVFSSLNGRKTAHVAVFALPGANALQVAGEVRALMAGMSEVFPPGLEYTSLYDTTVFIQQSIGAVYKTLIEAGAAGAGRDPALPAGLARDADAGDHRAGDDHRRVRGDGGARLHRQPDPRCSRSCWPSASSSTTPSSSSRVWRTTSSADPGAARCLH